MAEPAWFFSSLSQVTAAIVGFVGGFIILRLQQLIQDWRSLSIRLQSARDAWLAADVTIEQTREREHRNPELRAEVDRSMKWEAVMQLVEKREHVQLPAELGWGGLLLLGLLAVGTLVPLWNLRGPSNSVQSWFLIPWSGLVAVFGLLMFVQARSALDEVRSFDVGPRAREAIEEDKRKTQQSRREDG